MAIYPLLLKFIAACAFTGAVCAIVWLA